MPNILSMLGRGARKLSAFGINPEDYLYEQGGFTGQSDLPRNYHPDTASTSDPHSSTTPYDPPVQTQVRNPWDPNPQATYPEEENTRVTLPTPGDSSQRWSSETGSATPASDRYQELLRNPPRMRQPSKTRSVLGAIADTAGSWGGLFGVPRSVTHDVADEIRYGRGFPQQEREYAQNVSLAQAGATEEDRRRAAELRLRGVQEQTATRREIAGMRADQEAERAFGRAKDRWARAGAEPVPEPQEIPSYLPAPGTIPGQEGMEGEAFSMPGASIPQVPPGARVETLQIPGGGEESAMILPKDVQEYRKFHARQEAGSAPLDDFTLDTLRKQNPSWAAMDKEAVRTMVNNVPERDRVGLIRAAGGITREQERAKAPKVTGPGSALVAPDGAGGADVLHNQPNRPFAPRTGRSANPQDDRARAIADFLNSKYPASDPATQEKKLTEFRTHPSYQADRDQGVGTYLEKYIKVSKTKGAVGKDRFVKPGGALAAAAPAAPASAPAAAASSPPAGRIRVRLSNGSTGTIDATEFDPATMTKLPAAPARR
jgi:hypothetical protein